MSSAFTLARTLCASTIAADQLCGLLCQACMVLCVLAGQVGLFVVSFFLLADAAREAGSSYLFLGWQCGVLSKIAYILAEYKGYFTKDIFDSGNVKNILRKNVSKVEKFARTTPSTTRNVTFVYTDDASGKRWLDFDFENSTSLLCRDVVCVSLQKPRSVRIACRFFNIYSIGPPIKSTYFE